MKNNIMIPELLAPAGNFQALEACIDAGADAVYFGSTAFSCRMRAGNFDSDEIKAALKLCRDYNVKSYVTVNTRIKDNELSDVKSLINLLYENGVDAIIATDLALVKMVKNCFPGLSIHASTQVTGVNALDAKALENIGFSRMVCPRELSKEQIKKLAKESPIGIEMFIHGAHCASFSGQCLASFVLGGRSGNRGECAQPCRLPYSVNGEKTSYPLSIKDMCLAGNILDILDLGVESLKIEGRQKSPEYCYGVTKVYRKLLDEKRNASKEEIEYLSDLFNRDGFTNGYFTRKYGNMIGVRQPLNNENELTPFAGIERKLPLDMSFVAKKDEPMTLEIFDKTANITTKSIGKVLDVSINQPLSKEIVTKNLSKLGSTAYCLDNLDVDLDDGLWCSMGEINALRRDALNKVDEIKLAQKLEGRALNKEVKENTFIEKTPHKLRFTAEFTNVDTISESAKDFFDKIYVPDSEYISGSGYGINVSPVIFDEKDFPYDKVKEAKSVMVHGIGQIEAAKQTGADIMASYRLNVFNNEANKELKKMNCCDVIASPELSLAAIKDLDDITLIVYGRLPLMLLARCPQSFTKSVKCVGCGGYSEAGKHENKYCSSCLEDRKGKEFPLIGYKNCMNVLYNSVPIYMGDKFDLLKGKNIVGMHFIFTTETKKEVDNIINGYKNRELIYRSEDIRRIK